MNLRTVAEGVQTLNQAEFLLGAGCHIAQGYYYSRPLLQDAYAEYVLTAKEPKTLCDDHH